MGVQLSIVREYLMCNFESVHVLVLEILVQHYLYVLGVLPKPHVSAVVLLLLAPKLLIGRAIVMEFNLALANAPHIYHLRKWYPVN